jgi:hypothetical protein
LIKQENGEIMEINSKRLVDLAKALKKDVSGMYCRSAVTVGKIGDTTFGLTAYSNSGAEDNDIDAPLEINTCISQQ